MAVTDRFTLFGAQHLCVLFSLFILGAFVAWGGRRWRGPATIWMGRILGVLLVGYGLEIYVEEAMGGGLHGSYSLPMQLCDWVAIACAVTLFHPNALASEIAYFWGSAGTFQAVLTPDLTQGFPSWRFFQFFWGHGVALLSIVFILAARHFRPRPMSVLRMMIALNVYGVIALGLDLVFGWNYGYLLQKPAESSLFDFLGPWPWYLASVEVIGLISFWLLGLPWKISDRRRARQSRSNDPP